MRLDGRTAVRRDERMRTKCSNLPSKIEDYGLNARKFYERRKTKEEMRSYLASQLDGVAISSSECLIKLAITQRLNRNFLRCRLRDNGLLTAY